MSQRTPIQSDSLIGKIKSRGHWQVRFLPLTMKSIALEPLSKCKTVVEAASVVLRGWDYPHVSRLGGDEFEIGNDFYALGVDWKSHIEYWRMYQSSQFVHLIAVHEDWGEEEPENPWLPKEPGKELSIIGSLIYELTEMFEFLSRLAQGGLYLQGSEVFISLVDTKNRILTMNDSRRAGFFQTYHTSRDRIDYNVILNHETMIESPSGNARRAISFIYERFGYTRYVDDQIREMQQELYRIYGNAMK